LCVVRRRSNLAIERHSGFQPPVGRLARSPAPRRVSVHRKCRFPNRPSCLPRQPAERRHTDSATPD
jgi:hypothetical protein